MANVSTVCGEAMIDPLFKRWDVYGVYHDVAALKGLPRLCDLKVDDEKPWAWGALVAWPVTTCLACVRVREFANKDEFVWNGFEYERRWWHGI
jgi:hypothetical protein